MTIIGNNIIHFDQLPSTNAHAAYLLSKSKPSEGTVISTDNQYDGKGQLSNKWESAPFKNVSLSVILYPTFLTAQDQFRFNQAVSLAIFHTIEAILPGKVRIKWPNDIYIQNRKVAGILIQNQIQGKKISTSIIGIGINVNQGEFKSDAPNPTSLFIASGKVIDLINFRESLYSNLTQQYHALRLKAYKTLNDQYLQLMYQKNTLAKYMIKDNQEVEGTITGVNDHGLLQVIIDGKVHEFGFKEIRYL